MTETTFWNQLRSGKFAKMIRETSKGKALCNPAEVYNITKPLFVENDDVETVYCIFLDGQNQILAIEKMFTGTLTCAIVYPREIIKRIIALKAAATIMLHNHPSGDTTPSKEDKALTKKVIYSLAVIDVLFHDHIIVGNGYHSMSEDGWMKAATDQCRQFFSSQS